MEENATIEGCIICGKTEGIDGKGICRHCGDPEMVTIHYNRFIIKMTPQEFFFNRIRELLVEEGVRILTPDDCRGLVLKVKTPRGVIDEIKVFSEENHAI